MLASQLLYTSWKNGNSTTKGYMVYSKSKDITDVEETEICALMKYKAPDNLPYTPSPDEIENMFPKMFAYFKLSSGRFCIAQSSYIGQDYTNRWGNYIIHAYVLNDIGDLVPARMIGADLFRKRLTEEELNAEFAPESLPQVDITYSGNAMSEPETKRFFNTVDKQAALKALAQSVCDAVSNKKRVSFMDDLTNMRMWLATLSVIVPKKIMNQVYFSTYTTENSELLTLLCKQGDSLSNAYSQPYTPSDLICIDATQKNSDAITVGCYVDAVCNKFLDGYYEGILCANNVNKSMSDYACENCDLAYKLTCVQKGEPDCISSNEELLSIIEMTAKHGMEKEIFEKIFFWYSCSEMYAGDAPSVAVFRVLYPRISAERKADLLMMYVDKKLENNNDASSAYEEIKRDCPCEWEEATLCFLRQSFREHFGQHLSRTTSLLLCHSWINVYQGCSEEQQQKALEEIRRLYAEQVACHDTRAISGILESSRSIDKKLYFSVYTSACKTVERFGEDDKYLFEYLKLTLDDGRLFWAVLLYEYSQSYVPEQYIKNFITLQNDFSAQVESLVRYADENPRVCQFVEDVKIYTFEHMETDRLESLVDSYKRNISNSTSSEETTNKCREIFAQKIKIFLRNCDAKESTKYSISLYDSLYRRKELVDADRNALDLLASTIYNDNQKDIAFISKCLTKTPVETVIAFKNSCESVGLTPYPRAQLMYEGYFLEKAAERDGRLARRQVQEMYDNDGFAFLSKSCSNALLKEFMDNYMDGILKGMYLIYARNNDLNPCDVVGYFLTPISKVRTAFEENILQAWKGDVGTTNENMGMYFAYIFEKTTELRNDLWDLVEKHLIRIGKGKRNSLFDQLTKYFQDFDDGRYAPKMERYIREFNRNNISFGDKIKNLFSVKEGKRNNDKEK